MDLDGQYFPEEEQYPSGNSWKIVKKIFVVIMISLAALVWLLLFLTIFLRRDNALLKTVIFSENAREIYAATPKGETFETYQIFTEEFMDKTATIQFKMIAYANNAGELEIGIRLSAEILGNNAERELYFTLTDSEGNTYPMVNRIAATKDIQWGKRIKFIYRYERISFGDIYFNIDKNIINQETSSGEEKKKVDPGISYYLNVFKKETDENPVFSTMIYNNETYIKEITYKLPKEKYLK